MKEHSGTDITLGATGSVPQSDLQEMMDRLYQEFQDYKIQASRTLLVHQQQHEQQIKDLITAKQSQDRQI